MGTKPFFGHSRRRRADCIRRIFLIAVAWVAIFHLPQRSAFAAEIAGLARILDGGWSVDCASDYGKWRIFDAHQSFAFGPRKFASDVLRTEVNGNVYSVVLGDLSKDVFKVNPTNASNHIEYLFHETSDGIIDQDWRYEDGSGVALYKCSLPVSSRVGPPPTMVGNWSVTCDKGRDFWRTFNSDTRVNGPKTFSGKIAQTRTIGNIAIVSYETGLGEIFEINDNGTIRLIADVDKKSYISKPYPPKKAILKSCDRTYSQAIASSDVEESRGGAVSSQNRERLVKLVMAAGTCYAQKELTSLIENKHIAAIASKVIDSIVERKKISEDDIRKKMILVELKKYLKGNGHEDWATALDIEQFAECVYRRGI